MIKLTQNWDGVESDCFIKTTGIVSVYRSPANGLTMVFFESTNFITNVTQTPAEVVALIEESLG